MLYVAPWLEDDQRVPLSAILQRDAHCRVLKINPTAHQTTYSAAWSLAPPDVHKKADKAASAAVTEWEAMIAWRQSGNADDRDVYNLLTDPLLEYIFLLGGRAGGKSWDANEALIRLCGERKLTVIHSRVYMTSIRRSSRADLIVQVRRLPVADQQRWSIREHELEHENGSLISFVGLQNADSLRSTADADLLVVEEAESLDQDTLDTVIPSIRKAGSKLMFVFNPKRATAPVQAMAMGDDRPEASAVRITNFEDNPHLFKLRLLNDIRKSWRTNPTAFRHIWRGGVTSTHELQVVSDLHFGKPPLRPEADLMCQTVYGGDAGTNDPTVVLKCAVFPPQAVNNADGNPRDPDFCKPVVWIQTAVHEPVRHGAAAARLIRRFLPWLAEQRDIVQMDASATWLINSLNDAGILCEGVKSADGKLAGIDHMNQFEIWVDDRPLPGRNPQELAAMQRVAKELQNHHWKRGPDGRPLTIDEHQFSHSTDACRYGLDKVYPNDVINADGGVYYIDFGTLVESTD